MSGPTLTELCKLQLTLDFNPIGAVPAGFRMDVPFEGTATSSEWDGEIPAVGVDRLTVGAEGIQNLDIVGRIGSGKEVISYRGFGRGDENGPRELFTFETANEKFAHLNRAIGVGIGSVEGNQLSLTVYLVRD